MDFKNVTRPFKLEQIDSMKYYFQETKAFFKETKLFPRKCTYFLYGFEYLVPQNCRLVVIFECNVETEFN